MIVKNKSTCSICGGNLKYRDSVKRIVRTKARETRRIKVPRLRCLDCGILRRQLPDFLLPFKQYEVKIIRGVLEGIITTETLGYEDYPCELTMSNWWKETLAELDGLSGR